MFFSCFVKPHETWKVFLDVAIEAVFFITSLIFIPKTNEDGSPIVIKKKQKNYHQKVHKRKKPFISEQEWQQLEEEEDELMYIEEMEDD